MKDTSFGSSLPLNVVRRHVPLYPEILLRVHLLCLRLIFIESVWRWLLGDFDLHVAILFFLHDQIYYGKKDPVHAFLGRSNQPFPPRNLHLRFGQHVHR